jgi:hypothetical protein
MNTKDIRLSSDPLLSSAYDALLRASESALDLAVQTNTALYVNLDGKDQYLYKDDIIQYREKRKQAAEAAAAELKSTKP